MAAKASGGPPCPVRQPFGRPVDHRQVEAPCQPTGQAAESPNQNAVVESIVPPPAINHDPQKVGQLRVTANDQEVVQLVDPVFVLEGHEDRPQQPAQRVRLALGERGPTVEQPSCGDGNEGQPG